jgi:soluble lytic murein transglycosylase
MAVGVFTAARMKYPLKYEGTIVANAKRRQIDPALLAAIVYEESKFDRQSKSGAGAIGLMQLMPSTAAWVAEEMAKPGLAENLKVATSNVVLGSWYFRYLLDKYEDESLALAAYNGGEKNLNEWLAENPGLAPEETIKRIPFRETYEFVRRVEGTKHIYHVLYPALRR